MVSLRKMNVNDLEFLLEVRNDESTRNNLENNSVFNYSECKMWFETMNPQWYIIETNGHPVGYIRTDGDEVGADIHPIHRRNGYARMAYELYLKDKEYATLWVFEDNFAKTLYTKLNFKDTDEIKTVRDRKYRKMVYQK